MEEIDGFRIKRDVWNYAEGFVPIIEATGRDESGRLLRGSQPFTNFGAFEKRGEALRAAATIPVISVKVIDGQVLIRLGNPT